MKYLTFLTCILISSSCLAKMKEADYVRKYCQGEIEHRNSDGTRIDCLTSTEAIEFDFGKKWAECIGQALYYSKVSGKQPVCTLIIDDSETRFLSRAKEVSSLLPNNFKITTIPKE